MSRVAWSNEARRASPSIGVLRRLDGEVVCERCVVAASVLARMRGLLGRQELPRGEGLLLRPAASIHTGFMRFPIDVVFLDRDQVVVKVVRELAPWRAALAKGAASALELPAGECERRGVHPGDRLMLERAGTGGSLHSA